MRQKKTFGEKKLFFSHISEYEALPFFERKAYVSKLISMFKFAVEGATQREKWVNEARKDAAQAHKEIEGFKSSFWYRAYKFFS